MTFQDDLLNGNNNDNSNDNRNDDSTAYATIGGDNRAKVQTKITAKREKVTPEMAREFLKRNFGNRKMSKPKLAQYTNDMRNGDWIDNGESIQFDWFGVLFNGQTRLNAIIDSGVTIYMLIVRGLNPDAYLSVDNGKPRSAGDSLSKSDTKYPNEIAGAIKLLLAYDGGYINKPYQIKQIRHVEVRTYFNDNRQLEKQAIEVLKFLGRVNTKKLPKLVAIAAFVLFSRHTEEYAVLFFDLLTEGGNNKTIFSKLATKIINDHQARISMQPFEHLGVVIDAWNVWHSGKVRANLSWQPGEEFPKHVTATFLKNVRFNKP